MAYQVWTLHPVKPRKGDSRYKGQTVTYSTGTEGDAAADLRHVRKLIARLDGDGTQVLVAKVNGHAIHVGDAEFLSRCAA